MLLIQNCGILDPSLSDRVLEGRDILVSGSRISSVRKTGDLKGDVVISGMLGVVGSTRMPAAITQPYTKD